VVTVPVVRSKVEAGSVNPPNCFRPFFKCPINKPVAVQIVVQAPIVIDVLVRLQYTVRPIKNTIIVDIFSWIKRSVAIQIFWGQVLLIEAAIVLGWLQSVKPAEYASRLYREATR
jgi:hypothetical protein